MLKAVSLCVFRWVAIFMSLILLLFSSIVRAEDVSHAIVVRPGLLKGEDFLAQISRAEDHLRSKLMEGAYEEANEPSARLVFLREQSGLRDLTGISLWLLNEAYARAETHREEALFFLRKAKELSPRSVTIELRALPLDVSLERMNPVKVVLRGVSGLMRSPAEVIRLLGSVVYPTLVGLTVGLLILLIGVLLPRLSRLGLLSGRSSLLNYTVGAALFLAPLTGGPLWCLVVWGGLATRVRGSLSLAWASVALITLWGALSPIRESARLWYTDEKMVSVALLTNHELPARAVVESLSKLAGSEPRGALGLALAQLERRRGNFENSSRLLSSLEREGALREAALFEHSIVSLLSQRYRDAASYLREIGDPNLPEILFNQSRASFGLTMAADGQALYEKAQAGDPDLVRSLAAREAIEGIRVENVLAERALGMGPFWGEVLGPRSAVKEAVDTSLGKVGTALTPPRLFLAALVLLVVGVVRRRSGLDVSDESGIAERVISTVTLASLVLRGRPMLVWFSVSIVAIFACIAIGIPSDVLALREVFPKIRFFSASLAGSLAVMLWYAAEMLSQRRRNR